MTDEFRSKAMAVRAAVERVREGRVERTVLKVEGGRAYSETVPRDPTPASGTRRPGK
jgi:hypothetical protein